MKLIALTCNNCGAAVDVSETTRFLTCASCGSRLAVVRTESSAFTELIEKIDLKTDWIAKQVAAIEFHNEIKRIDADWQQERASYLVNGFIPDQVSASFQAAIAVFIGLVFSVAGAILDDMTVALFGMGTLSMSIILYLTLKRKARLYEKARAAYLERRDAVNWETFVQTNSGTS